MTGTFLGTAARLSPPGRFDGEIARAFPGRSAHLRPGRMCARSDGAVPIRTRKLNTESDLLGGEGKLLCTP